MISAILPCYNEADNIAPIVARLQSVAASVGGEWEFIFVDDHSADRTAGLLRELGAGEPRLKSIRFSRNFGSHAAIAAGLAHCRGDIAFILAADGQDPPEEVPAMLAKRSEGFSIVWARRAGRVDSAFVLATSRLYWGLMRLIALRNLPPGGSDMLLLDRRVIDAVNAMPERNTSILALIAWTGFEQASVPYTKQARMSGDTKWTISGKVKLAFDSLVSFSSAPIRLVGVAGLAASLAGVGVAAFCPASGGATAPGGLMALMLIVGGVQMMMLGLLGEYLWRALDESRSRPRYIVAEMLNMEK